MLNLTSWLLRNRLTKPALRRRLGVSKGLLGRFENGQAAMPAWLELALESIERQLDYERYQLGREITAQASQRQDGRRLTLILEGDDAALVDRVGRIMEMPESQVVAQAVRAYWHQLLNPTSHGVNYATSTAALTTVEILPGQISEQEQ